MGFDFLDDMDQKIKSDHHPLLIPSIPILLRRIGDVPLFQYTIGAGLEHLPPGRTKTGISLGPDIYSTITWAAISVDRRGVVIFIIVPDFIVIIV